MTAWPPVVVTYRRQQEVEDRSGDEPGIIKRRDVSDSWKWDQLGPEIATPNEGR
jgi:hypothetical protein